MRKLLSAGLVLLLIILITLYKEYSQKKIREEAIQSTITDLLNTPKDTEETKPYPEVDSISQVSDNNIVANEKYAFAIITYNDLIPNIAKGYTKKPQYYISSDIRYFFSYTEEAGYEYKDALLKELLSKPSVYDKEIVSNKLFIFDTKLEALKAKEKSILQPK